jgi:hypothetical protein
MAANTKMVTAVFRNRLNAERAFDILHTLGYTDAEINVLMSEKTRSTYYEGQEEERLGTNNAAGEGAAIGGAVGTAVGASLAAIAAIGTSLVVPGLGLIIAGPIAAALAGGGAGAVAGGLVGGLIGLGITEDNARAYEAVLRDGGVVIGVVPRNDADTTRIKKEFERLQGENVYVCSC